MKTLIAALALTVAAAAPAFAFDSEVAANGIGASLVQPSYDAVQVSGFTGIADGAEISTDRPEDGGLPYTLQHNANFSNVQVSGFTGIAGGAEISTDRAEDGGLPLVLQNR